MNEGNLKQNKGDNLTRKERKALNELTQNPYNIVINRADKVNTIVIENRTEYIQNAMTYVNDREIQYKTQI